MKKRRVIWVAEFPEGWIDNTTINKAFTSKKRLLRYWEGVTVKPIKFIEEVFVEKKEPELKDCPFCGAIPVPTAFSIQRIIHLDGCFLKMLNGKDQAICYTEYGAWNRRPSTKEVATADDNHTKRIRND